MLAAVVVTVAKLVPAVVVTVPVTAARAPAVVAPGEQRNKDNDQPRRVKPSALHATRFHEQILGTNAANTR
jgi:hypothetical protein